MSANAIHQAFEKGVELHLDASSRAVLIFLAYKINPSNQGTPNWNCCWPSVGTISEQTGLAPRTVQNKLKNLRNLDAISIFSRYHEREGRKNYETSKYRLDFLKPDQ